MGLFFLEFVVFLAAAAWLTRAWVGRVERDKKDLEQLLQIPAISVPAVEQVTLEQVEGSR